MSPLAAAAVLAAGAAAVWWDDGPIRRLSALGVPDRSGSHRAPVGRQLRGWCEHPFVWLLVAALGASGGLLAGPVAGALSAAAGFAVAAGARSRRRAHAEQATRTAVVDVALALAAELRGGQPPAAALSAAAEVAGPLRSALTEAAAAGAIGAEPTGPLRVAAQRPGAEGLRAVAAAWQVAAGVGAALAVTLAAVAGGLEHREEVRHHVEAQLAGPRATARALLGLPVVGVVMATAVGAHPGHLLLHTFWGALLCGGAAALAGAGFWWIERLARRAAPS